MSLKDSLGQGNVAYHNAIKKAMHSRDKKLVQEIKNLEKVYETKREKLEKEAEKTMDPTLRKEWKQAQKEYSNYMNKMMLKLDN